ncbi:MAG: GMC family oxidoreductase [Chloroflexota bacterium]
MQGTSDAIVIGSGPGGATVARELSQRGARVLILERGSNAELKGTMYQTLGMALVPGRNLLFTEELLALIRATTVGGSSILAYATAFEPPYSMFEARGVHLKQEVEEVRSELPIGPLADELVGPAAQRIMESARELGYRWAKLPKIAYQDKCRPDCDKCTMGCPYGAKWTARMYVDEARSHGATLVTGARIRQLDVRNGKVESVDISKDGSQYRLSAPLVILSAGGIGTPLILRASGIADAGHDFFIDPLVVVMGTVEHLHGGKEFPMAAGMYDPGEGYVMTDLVWPLWISAAFTAEVLRFDRIAAHANSLPIMVKIKDDLGGSLTAGGGVRKRLTQADRTRLSRGAAVARRILKQAGASHVFQTWTTAVHPGGTAKIGDVVDSDLRSRFENLYVCDCSVIPESWGLPPTLTIIALARRLAKHLAH